MIETEEQYRAALEKLSSLMDAKANSEEGNELSLLADEIEQYEDIHYPIEKPTEKEMFDFRIDQLGLTDDLNNNGIGIRLKKSGWTDMVVRKHHNKYEYLAYVDHYGGERWSVFPFLDGVIEKQILELNPCER